MVEPVPRGVVLDTSVILNVIATDIPGELLSALGAPTFVPRNAHREVLRDPRGRHTPAEILDPIIAAGILTIVDLEAEEPATFLELVSASQPDDLDDGEAAVIACAHHRGLAVAIDETKALRIIRARFPSIRHFFTVDLFGLAKTAGVAAAVVQQAYDDARKFARMRVPKTRPV